MIRPLRLRARRLLHGAIDRALAGNGGAPELPSGLERRLVRHLSDWARDAAPRLGDAEVRTRLLRARGGLRRPARAVLLEREVAREDPAELAELLDSAGPIVVARDLATFAHAALVVGGPARARLERELDADGADRLTAAERARVAALLLAAGDRPRAVALAETDRLEPADREWLSRWLPSGRELRPAGDVPTIALIDYRHPVRSRASTNVGDWVQTLALSGHLVRQRRLRLASPEPGLAAALAALADAVPDEQRVDGIDGALEVVTLDRDFSSGAIPAGDVWLFAFGWYMDPLLGDRFDFPFAPGVRPLFVSFHVHDHRFLTSAAIAYLRQNGPVGCRDWTTVRVLREKGVPAFFSGCLTTTLGIHFAPRGPGEQTAGVAFVDALPREDEDADGAALVRQSTDEVLERGFPANLLAAREFLARLRQHSAVVTSRLHSYLPARALGVPVDFRPADRADPRFEGLVGVSDAAFETIRDRLIARIGDTLERITAGASEEEVRSAWAAAWSAELAEPAPSDGLHRAEPAP